MKFGSLAGLPVFNPFPPSSIRFPGSPINWKPDFTAQMHRLKVFLNSNSAISRTSCLFKDLKTSEREELTPKLDGGKIKSLQHTWYTSPFPPPRDPEFQQHCKCPAGFCYLSSYNFQQDPRCLHLHHQRCNDLIQTIQELGSEETCHSWDHVIFDACNVKKVFKSVLGLDTHEKWYRNTETSFLQSKWLFVRVRLLLYVYYIYAYFRRVSLLQKVAVLSRKVCPRHLSAVRELWTWACAPTTAAQRLLQNETKWHHQKKSDTLSWQHDFNTKYFFPSLCLIRITQSWGQDQH